MTRVLPARPSEIVAQLTGYDTPPVPEPRAPTLAFLTQECRSGSLSEAATAFLSDQVETLYLDTLVIEQAVPDKIVGKVRGKTEDHEGASPFDVEVGFELNPATGKFTRL